MFNDEFVDPFTKKAEAPAVVQVAQCDNGPSVLDELQSRIKDVERRPGATPEVIADELLSLIAVREMDMAWAFGADIARDLKETTKLRGITEEMTMRIMISIASTGLGKFVSMKTGPFENRSTLYNMIVALSGGTKSQITAMLLGFLKDWGHAFAMYHSDKMTEIEHATRMDEKTGKEVPIPQGDKISRKSKQHYDKIVPFAQNMNEAALGLVSKNSSVLAFYDEAKMFFDTWCPGRPTDKDNGLNYWTQQFDEEDDVTIRVAVGERDVFNRNVGLLMTGTRASYTKFMDQAFIEGGGLWRYDIYVAPLTDDEDEELSIDEVMSRPIETVAPLESINAVLLRLYEQNFMHDFAPEVQEEMKGPLNLDIMARPVTRARTKKDEYVYTPGAKALKEKMSQFLIYYFATAFAKSKWYRLNSAASKMPQRIDRYAIIVQAIRNAANPVNYQGHDNVIMVDEHSLNVAFHIARMTIKGWVDFMDIKPEEVNPGEAKSIAKAAGSTACPKALQHLINMLGTYDLRKPVPIEMIEYALTETLKTYDGVKTKRNLRTKITKIIEEQKHVTWMDNSKTMLFIHAK